MQVRRTTESFDKRTPFAWVSVLSRAWHRLIFRPRRSSKPPEPEFRPPLRTTNVFFFYEKYFFNNHINQEIHPLFLHTCYFSAKIKAKVEVQMKARRRDNHSRSSSAIGAHCFLPAFQRQLTLLSDCSGSSRAGDSSRSSWHHGWVSGSSWRETKALGVRSDCILGDWSQSSIRVWCKVMKALGNQYSWLSVSAAAKRIIIWNTLHEQDRQNLERRQSLETIFPFKITELGTFPVDFSNLLGWVKNGGKRGVEEQLCVRTERRDLDKDGKRGKKEERAMSPLLSLLPRLQFDLTMWK